MNASQRYLCSISDWLSSQVADSKKDRGLCTRNRMLFIKANNSPTLNTSFLPPTPPGIFHCSKQRLQQFLLGTLPCFRQHSSAFDSILLHFPDVVTVTRQLALIQLCRHRFVVNLHGGTFCFSTLCVNKRLPCTLDAGNHTRGVQGRNVNVTPLMNDLLMSDCTSSRCRRYFKYTSF